MNLFKTTATLILIITVVYILVATSQFFIPFALALLIWYFIKEVKGFINKSAWIKRKLPMFLQSILVMVIIFGLLAVLSSILSLSISSFSKEIPKYEANIRKIAITLNQTFGFDIFEITKTFFGNLKFTQLIQPVLNNLSVIIGNGFMVLLYVIFLILEETIFMKKIELIFNTPSSFQKASNLIQKIDDSFSNYFNLKTLMSALTGFLSFWVLYFFDVDAPLLWASIIFLLNYIPSIGSLIATIFPTVIAMLQNGDIQFGLYVLLGVSAVQLLVGNVIEPRVMGSSLNISPLVVIISLVVWGAIWGLLGMFLSVPITVIMIIIFSQFPSTRAIAILLSSDGQIKTI